MKISVEGQTPAIADQQYSLVKILAIWASVTLPMGLLAWVVAPLLIPYAGIDPGIVYWLLMIAGMAWQFIVAIVVLRRERPAWTWGQLKARLWLVAPVLPSSGRKSGLIYLWILPAILFVGLTSDVFGTWLDTPMRWIFPSFRMPDYSDIRQLISPQYHGQWWLLAIALTSNLFNYFLGEALLFHGVLLPKMRGVFGRWAWLANAVLFGLYHVHLFGQLPSIIISNMAYSLPAQRYKSVWLAVIVHGFEGLVVLALTMWVILGMPAG